MDTMPTISSLLILAAIAFAVGFLFVVRARVVKQQGQSDQGVVGLAAAVRYEQAIIRAAKQHEGKVNAALAAMEAPDLSVAQAEAILQQLAEKGICLRTSDEAGRLVYEFELDLTDEPLLEPDEWVEAQDRMAGQPGNQADEQLDA